MPADDVVTYDRTYVLQSCHFNGGAVYVNYALSLKAAETGNWQDACTYLAKVMPEIHGHNFKVRILAKGTVDGNGYTIDDQFLEEEIIKRWDNVNLSTLPEFAPMGVRATTENMASILLKRIWATFPLQSCRVEVWETEQICAVSEC